MAQLLSNEDMKAVLEDLFNQYFHFLPDVPQTALVTANRVSAHIFPMSSADLANLHIDDFAEIMRQRVDDLCFKFKVSVEIYSESPVACILDLPSTVEDYPLIRGTLKCGLGYMLTRQYNMVHDLMYMTLFIGTYK